MLYHLATRAKTFCLRSFSKFLTRSLNAERRLSSSSVSSSLGDTMDQIQKKRARLRGRTREDLPVYIFLSVLGFSARSEFSFPARSFSLPQPSALDAPPKSQPFSLSSPLLLSCSCLTYNFTTKPASLVSFSLSSRLKLNAPRLS